MKRQTEISGYCLSSHLLHYYHFHFSFSYFSVSYLGKIDLIAGGRAIEMQARSQELV